MEGAVTKETQGRLQSLRHVLLEEGASSALALFDEFVREHEFNLALHVVCDYVLDSDSRQVSESIIDQIQLLHTAMEIDDACFRQLRTHKSA
jgi:hypothetical protein